MSLERKPQHVTELPPGWNYLAFGDIAKSQYGISVAVEDGGAVPILGMKNLQDGVISFSNVSRVELSPDEISIYRLKRRRHPF